MRDIKKLKSIIGCTNIFWKEEEKKTRTEKSSSLAIPLIAVCSTAPFSFSFPGNSLPGPNDLFKWWDFDRPRILGYFINFYVPWINEKQHIKYPREHKIYPLFFHMFILKPQCFIDILYMQQINWFLTHVNSLPC